MPFNISDWLPQPPWFGPPVPRWANDPWAEFWKVRQREIADLKNEVGGASTVLPDLVYLALKSIGSAAVDWAFTPGTLAKWVAVLDEEVAREGKFTQFSVFYRDISPPPLMYDYKCRKCLKWGPNQPIQPLAGTVITTDRTCLWIAGDISPEGWCACWVPNTDQQPFTWPKQLVSGDW
jgi:hypothetical protein